jgi:hypothetical protein
LNKKKQIRQQELYDLVAAKRIGVTYQLQDMVGVVAKMVSRGWDDIDTPVEERPSCERDIMITSTCRGGEAEL